MITVDANDRSEVFEIGQGASVTLKGLTITDGNSDNSGAGISNDHATLTLANTTVSSNTSNIGSGGGISNNQGTVTLTNSTVSGDGSAISAGGNINTGTLTLTNSIVSGNSAPKDGGGIWNNGTLILTNSTVANNTANGDATSKGGGISNFVGATAILRNTIVARDSSPSNPDTNRTFTSQRQQPHRQPLHLDRVWHLGPLGTGSTP